MDISIRKVKADDWDFILEVRNEKEIRQVSNNNEIITKSKHYDYMRNLEQMENVYQWIITFENKDVGYAKIINSELSYMIKKGFRGMGIGHDSFKLIEEEAKKIGMRKIVAKIKIDNLASLNWIRKAGYQQNGIIYNQDNLPYEYIMEKTL